MSLTRQLLDEINRANPMKPDVPLGGSDSPSYHNEIKQDQSKFAWQNRSGRPMNPVPLVILSPAAYLPIHERQLRP
jgi:hypothetical protein